MAKLRSVMSEGAAGFAGRVSLDDVSRLSYFVVGALAQFVDTVSSVQGAADLLISLDEAFELPIEVSVLTIQNSAVVTEGFDLRVGVIVATSKGLVGETELFLFTSGYCEVVVSIAVLGFQVVEVGSKISVAAQLNLGSSSEVSLLSKLGIKLTGEFTLLLLEASLFISGTA